MPLTGKGSSSGDENMPLDSNAVQSSMISLILKSLAVLACFLIGLKFLESFFIYSLASDGVRALPAYRDRYEAARNGRLLMMGAFVVSQIVGGSTLRSMIGWGSMRWGERSRSVLLFSGAFSLATGIAVAAIIWSH